MENEGFKSYLKERAQFCDRLLYRYFDDLTDDSTKLFEAINYSVCSGGKRLRMIMLLEAVKMFGGEINTAAPFAAALEMIHTYSLIHDDLPSMDNSDTRRGKPSCHKKYNECLAILAGDGLLSYAFEIMTKAALEHPKEVKYLKALNIIAEKAGLFGMVYGQALDTENPQPLRGLKEKIDQNKTAALFSAAVLAGAVLADAPESALVDAGAFGKCFGLAFQIIDDLKDGDAPPERAEEAAGHIAAAKSLIKKHDKNGFFSALCEHILFAQ